MSVSASDIVIYGAANIAEDDSSTQGGAIDTSVRYVFGSSTLVNDPADGSADGTLKAVSSAAGDTTQTVTVTGRNSEGSIVTDTFTLNGTTVVTGNSGTVFERILKIVVSASHTGTITVSDSTGGGSIGNTIVAIETGVLRIQTLFYNASADASGGSSRTFVEKVFIKNNNATNALLSAQVAEQSDPSSNITFDLEDAQNDNNSTASRLNTDPTGMLGSFSGSTKSCPGTDLGAGDSIGCWVKLTLAAGASSAKSTYTLRVTGSTI